MKTPGRSQALFLCGSLLRLCCAASASRTATRTAVHPTVHATLLALMVVVVMTVVLLHVGLTFLAIHAAAVHAAGRSGTVHSAIFGSRLRTSARCGSAPLLGAGSAARLLCHNHDARHCKNRRDRKYQPMFRQVCFLLTAISQLP
jgi:hypothetical protein